MKLFKYLLIITVVSFTGCNDEFLDLKPTDKVTASTIFSTPEGVEIFMADLYSNLPIEDFNSTPANGISFNTPGPNNAGFYPWVITDDGVGSQHESLDWGGAPNHFSWWGEGYALNRDVNLLFSVIPDLEIDQSAKDALLGEAYFMRAYIYFALAKRYGGVPLIAELANLADGEDGLKVPRSTEKETWDFVLASCDEAAALLGDGDGTRRRANKWVALALKSRAALHAASVAKYWDRVPLSGEAVDAKVVGMSAADAATYYAACISASEEIMNANKYSLYKATPANADEAVENYREMFENPNRSTDEVIFTKGFTFPGAGQGSNQDNWGNPAQTTGAWPHPGRFNPSLDLVDAYENYSTPGASAPIVTTVDGNTSNYSGYDAARTYLEYDLATDIFADKDARLRATIILPRSIWKGVDIKIQGGIIRTDGSSAIEAGNHFAGDVNGVIQYAYGGANPATDYSGFDTYGGNMTRTGFGFKKFLNQSYTPILAWNQSTTDWIDFRYAEILLNYAEAVAESGSGNAALAATAMNATRRRAGHTTDIALTVDNVLRERRVELAFENKRYWDLIRRREYHTTFNNSYRHALVPVKDLRTDKYIFVRKNTVNTFARTFLDAWYYKMIPGVATNQVIQNPQY